MAKAAAGKRPKPKSRRKTKKRKPPKTARQKRGDQAKLIAQVIGDALDQAIEARQGKHPGGRPATYNPKVHPQLATTLSRLGATDIEIADALHVTVETIFQWRAQFPEFSEAMRTHDKEMADDRVKKSVYHRAVGYNYDAEEVFCQQGIVTRVKVRKHVPPDTNAGLRWLMNRRPDEWRERMEHMHRTDPETAALRQKGLTVLLDLLHESAAAGQPAPSMIDVTPAPVPAIGGKR